MTDSVHKGSSREAGHGPDWGVIRCECGVLHVKLGPVRLEFTPAEFHRLQVLINRAAWTYEIERRSERAMEADELKPNDVCH
jgi:hypothetical protein